MWIIQFRLWKLLRKGKTPDEGRDFSLELEMIKANTKIIVETDDEERILKEIEELKLQVVDKRKYGRATLIFCKQ